MSNPMPSPSFINEEECNKVIQELFKSGDISSDGYDHKLLFFFFISWFKAAWNIFIAKSNNSLKLFHQIEIYNLIAKIKSMNKK